MINETFYDNGKKLVGYKYADTDFVKADNKKLAEVNDKLTHTPNRLRKKGLI